MAFVELFGDKLQCKGGEVATDEALKGKSYVMIYFSAHWCPPCRGFTPKLAEAYKSSSKAGKDVEIVFCSSDRDQEAFDGYFGEMPWVALPYSARSIKDKLSSAFSVNGIPTLIVLDGQGQLVTSDGRSKFQEFLGDAAVANAAANSGSGGAGGGLVSLFGDKLQSKSGEVATADTLSGKTYVMVYFSAHWCPPCRGFTPKLAEAYKSCEAAGKEVEVVFCSSDRDQAGFDEYYGEMPWVALPFAANDVKQRLSEKFSVNGIPMLIVLDGQGNVITTEGRAKYEQFLSAGGKGGSASKAACCTIC